MSADSTGLRLGQGAPGAELRRILQYRDLLVLLVQKDLKVKYRGAALGVFWSLLNPLLMMVVYTVVFSVLVRFSVPRYPIFILSALLPWNAFTSAVGTSVQSLLHNGNLIRRVHFPVEFLPLTTVLSSLVNLLLGFGLLTVFALVMGQPLGVPLLALPLVVLLQLLITAGIALAVSALTVYFRDLEHLVGVGLTVLFFITPILYPASLFSGKRMGVVLALNPFSWLAASYQAIWHENSWPSGAHLGGLFAAAVISLVAGILIFRRLQPRFAEEV